MPVWIAAQKSERPAFRFCIRFLKSLNCCCFRANYCSFLFLDTGAFTAALTLVVQLGTTYTAGFVQDDGFDVRRKERERPLHTNAVRDLAHGKGGCSACALFLDHIAFEGLDPLLV